MKYMGAVIANELLCMELLPSPGVFLTLQSPSKTGFSQTHLIKVNQHIRI